MSERKAVRFWAGLAVFQVVFGLAVFGLTRAYYIDDREQPGPNLNQLFGGTSFGQTAVQAAISSLPGGSSGVVSPPAGQATAPALPPGAADAALDSPEAMAELADSHFAAKQYAAAAELYGRLVEMDPGNVPLLNNLAITLHYVGRSDEAIKRLQAGLDIDPTHQRSWLTLGYIDSQIGDTDGARVALGQAYNLDPANDVGRSAAKMLTDMGLEIPGQ